MLASMGPRPPGKTIQHKRILEKKKVKCVNHPKREAAYPLLGLCRSCYQVRWKRGELSPKVREKKYVATVSVAMTGEMLGRVAAVAGDNIPEWIRGAIEEKLSDLDLNQIFRTRSPCFRRDSS